MAGGADGLGHESVQFVLEFAEAETSLGGGPKAAPKMAKRVSFSTFILLGPLSQKVVKSKGLPAVLEAEGEEQCA